MLYRHECSMKQIDWGWGVLCNCNLTAARSLRQNTKFRSYVNTLTCGGQRQKKKERGGCTSKAQPPSRSHFGHCALVNGGAFLRPDAAQSETSEINQRICHACSSLSICLSPSVPPPSSVQHLARLKITGFPHTPSWRPNPFYSAYKYICDELLEAFTASFFASPS